MHIFLQEKGLYLSSDRNIVSNILISFSICCYPATRSNGKRKKYPKIIKIPKNFQFLENFFTYLKSQTFVAPCIRVASTLRNKNNGKNLIC